MKKSTITATWLAGLAAIALGLVVLGIAIPLLVAHAGAQDAAFWTAIPVIAVGGLVAIAGNLAQLAAWIGALVNSYRLQDKAWFLIILILGLLGFGLVVMIVYLIAAPDGYEETQRQPAAPAPLPPSLPQAT